MLLPLLLFTGLSLLVATVLSFVVMPILDFGEYADVVVHVVGG